MKGSAQDDATRAAHIGDLLRQELARDERLRLHAVLDLARNPDLAAELSAHPRERTCLLGDGQPHVLRRAAPHLALLEPGDALFGKVCGQLWERDWGAFLLSRAGFSTLRLHLRRLLWVRPPSGRLALFRFFDPRVLRPFLPTCRGDQVEQVFGPAERYFCAGEDPGFLMEYWDHAGLPCRRHHRLEKRPAPRPDLPADAAFPG